MTKRFICFIVSLFLFIISHGQIAKGTVVRIQFLAPSIQGNPAGEQATRHITIYLPPGYAQGNERYPVIYFLHGYSWTDSSTMSEWQINTLLDTAIFMKHTKSVIMVLPDSYTRYGGSFYTNSTLTGNWADYIVKDVVNYVDQHYRTIAKKESRGIAGMSMGANGALKICMLYPEIFNAVYGATPATLNWSDGINTSLTAFKEISKAKNEEAIGESFPAKLFIDLARTYSPNLNKLPFYADMPAYYLGDSLIIDTATVNKWTVNFVTNMITSHLSALKSLRAIKIDWGRNDAGRHVPVTCLEFSKKLEWYGISHEAEEYLGVHAGNMKGVNGRIYTEILPFFDANLAPPIIKD
jgi:S-formylglutathione hydrolase FrmB